MAFEGFKFNDQPNSSGKSPAFSGFKFNDQPQSNPVEEALSSVPAPSSFFGTPKKTILPETKSASDFISKLNTIGKSTLPKETTVPTVKEPFHKRYESFMQNLSQDIIPTYADVGSGILKSVGSLFGGVEEIAKQGIINPIGEFIDKISGVQPRQTFEPGKGGAGNFLIDVAKASDQAAMGLRGRPKNYIEQVVEGFGSTLPFLLAGASSKLINAGASPQSLKTINTLLNLGLSGSEALTNGYNDYQDLLEKDDKNPGLKAMASFGANLGVNYITNKLGFLGEAKNSTIIKDSVKNFLASTLLETTQETAQQLMSNIVTGKPATQGLSETALVSLPISAIFGGVHVATDVQIRKQEDKIKTFAQEVADNGGRKETVSTVLAYYTGTTPEEASSKLDEILGEDSPIIKKFADNQAADKQKELDYLAASFKKNSSIDNNKVVNETGFDALKQEAKKYNTVDEFIKSQETKSPSYAIGEGSGHTAPYRDDYNAPAYELTKIYPSDVYDKGVQYYGSGYRNLDIKAMDILNKIKGNPDAEVTIYRAVPKDSSISKINAGDWVTLTKEYAQEHGKSNLNNKFKIISQKVKADEIFTDANSLQEFGYDPRKPTKSELTDIYNKAHGVDTLQDKGTIKEYGDNTLRSKQNSGTGESSNRGSGERMDNGSDSSLQGSRKLAEYYRENGGSDQSSTQQEQAQKIIKQESVIITPETGSVLKSLGFSDALVNKFEDAYKKGAVTNLQVIDNIKGEEEFVAMYDPSTDTLSLNPNELDHNTFQDGSVITHELDGHAWYAKLTDTGRVEFFTGLKNQVDTIKSAWELVGPDMHQFYWNLTINQVNTAILKKANKEIADEVLKFVGLKENPNMSLDMFIERTLNIDKTIEAINQELARRGLNLITLKAHNTLGVMEHGAMIAENADLLQANDSMVGRYIEDVQNGTLKFGPEGAQSLVYPGETDLSLTTLEKLKGRDTVSKQYISDLTNVGDIKQAERDVLRDVLSQYPDRAKIPVAEFAQKVKIELLPLTVQSSEGGEPLYEQVTLPYDLRGNVADYVEHIYESPIKTSAGDIHFRDGTENYFGHTRIEDMADNKTRRVIEVQSDLYQKGNLEQELPHKIDYSYLDASKIKQKPNNGLFYVEDASGTPVKFAETKAQLIKDLSGEFDKKELKRIAEVKKLQQYNDPTAHFRMVREEIKKAAQDGKTKLQFPTGETAMKIEGLGQAENNFRLLYEDIETPSGLRPSGSTKLTPEKLSVGERISQGNGYDDQWIITDVLGDGKFKAVPKQKWDDMDAGIFLYSGEEKRLNELWGKNQSTLTQAEKAERDALFAKADQLKESFQFNREIPDTEQFDISGKVDTNNPIYRFYEKDLGRYLKSKYDAKPITDNKGVTWYEVNIKPEMADQPVMAFRVPGEKNPKFDTGNKMEDLRLTLAHSEARVGAKPVNIEKLQNMLEREQTSLSEALSKPEAHVKAYGEDRIPKYEAKIEQLKTRIAEAKKNAPEPVIKKVTVSGKDIELSEELVRRQTELEIRREVLDANPLKSLLKYVSRRGHDAGQLPEIGSGNSKFRKSGDALIQQAMYEFTNAKDAPHDEDVRANMEYYLRDRQKLAEAETELARDIRTYIQAAKDELALNKISDTQATRIEKEIDKITRFKAAEKKVREEALAKQRAELEKKARKYGFTIPAYNENEFPEIGQLIAVEDQLKAHPARPFLKYMNKRTGILPEIQVETPGVYGEKMSTLLKKKGYSSVADAQKAVDNYIALSEYYDRLAEDRFNPIELANSESVISTPLYQSEKNRIGVDGSASLPTLEKDLYPLKSKVSTLDDFATPKFVFDQIGLSDEFKTLAAAERGYIKELPKNISKITEWAKRVPSKESARRIFDYLDGIGNEPDKNGFPVPFVLKGEEAKVADEIKAWLDEWAGRLHIPKHERIAFYITHIFENDLLKKEFDEELAKIIQDKQPGEVYNPFLEKRLGQLGYVHDVWRALDAYTKRATRKVYMDPALEKLKIATQNKPISITAADYVLNHVNNINMRPTMGDIKADIALKRIIGYKFGDRPVNVLSRKFRQLIYRGSLGLNPSAALRNLSQGTNTYAKLGEKYTAVGYIKLLGGLNQQELVDEGILSDALIQDRTLSATKKFWEKTDKGLFILFDTVEKINRGAAYWGAKAKYYNDNSRLQTTTVNGKKEEVRVFKEGSSEEGAREYARNLVEDTQFSFSAVNTPVIFGSDVAKTLLQFQSFNFKQAEFIGRMFKSREWAGLIRWVVSSLIFMITVGKLFNQAWDDLIPFYKYKLAPVVQDFLKIKEAILATPDQYGNKPNLDKRIKNVGDVALQLTPAGLQISKTIRGLESTKYGSPTIEKIRAALFGPVKTGDSSKISTSVDKSVKTAKTKLDAIDDNLVKDAKNTWEEIKKAGIGTDKADAIVENLTSQQISVVKLVKAADAGYWEDLAQRMVPIVEQAHEVGFNTDKSQEISDKLSKDQLKAAKLVKTALYGTSTESQGSSKWEEQSFITHVSNIAQAIGTDPVELFGNIFNGDWKVVDIKNGSLIINRMSKEESDAIRKKHGVTGNSYILDHIVPLTASGENTKYSESNLQIIPNEQWKINTPVEVYLGDALRDKKINGKQAREYAIRFKAGQKQPLSPQTQKEYKEKYNNTPLTFQQIKDLIDKN